MELLKDNSIATQLLKVVFSIYFSLTLVITAIHLYFEYQNIVQYTNNNLNAIVKSFEKPIAKAMWGYNNLQLQELKQAIEKLDTISLLQINYQTNSTITDNQKKEFNYFKKDIYFKDHTQSHYVGHIIVFYPKDIIFIQLKNSFFIILFAALFKSFILILLFIWAFKKYLLNHLNHLTHQLEEIKYETLDKAKLHTHSHSYELQLFIQQFNHMFKSLEESKQHIKKQESTLIEQNQLAETGRIIEQIAHQYRQPLNVLNGISGSLKYRINNNLYDKNFFNEQLNKSEQTTKYLSKMIDDFMNFYKFDREVLQMDLQEVISINIEVLKPILNQNNIQIINTINTPMPSTLQINPNKLSHVIFNILNNSIEAFKDSTSTHKYIFIDLDIQEKQVQLSIKDTAGGIPQEIENKIFDSYFTTKQNDKGTGLGLFMVKKLIEHEDASITFKNVSFEYNKKHHHGAQFDLIIAM